MNIIFDLDGTIWNAAQSTAVAWNHVFQKHNIDKVISKKDIESVAGKPYLMCLELLAPEVISDKNYSLILKDLSISEKSSMQKLGGELYEGVLENIPKISKDHRLFIVSNCVDWYLQAFLETSLGNFFIDSICHGDNNYPKHENINLIMKRNNLKEAIYIGDTLGDSEAAKMSNIEFYYVSYGFGDLNPNEYNKDFHSFEQLALYLINPNE